METLLCDILSSENQNSRKSVDFWACGGHLKFERLTFSTLMYFQWDNLTLHCKVQRGLKYQFGTFFPVGSIFCKVLATKRAWDIKKKIKGWGANLCLICLNGGPIWGSKLNLYYCQYFSMKQSRYISSFLVYKKFCKKCLIKYIFSPLFGWHQNRMQTKVNNTN